MKALISLVALSTVAGFAQTAATGGSKVAMIDIKRAVLATEDGKRDMEALKQKFEPRQAEVQRQAKDLQELAKPLAEGSKIADDARATLLKTVEQKRLALQHTAEDLQAEMRSEQNEIVSRVLKKLVPIIDKYGRENGYTMIFDAQFWPAGPVLWASGPAADITNAIVSAYNALPATQTTPTPSQ